MAKGIGLIGNFSGKVGNTVGYQLSASNNGQTQGVRVYQPNVKNPKTAAQAEQRAKLSPVNATYRTLKNVIDRGNEGVAYGNKSRLAWLKKAMKASGMPWFVKGTEPVVPVLCPITKGSLPSIFVPSTSDGTIVLPVDGLVGSEATVGAISTAIIAAYPSLKSGDQITFVAVEAIGGTMAAHVDSIVLDATSAAQKPSFITVAAGEISYDVVQADASAGCLIISREGANGEHLRSTESLHQMSGYSDTYTSAEAKTAAIKSYMTQAGAESDWAEESLQD